MYYSYKFFFHFVINHKVKYVYYNSFLYANCDLILQNYKYNNIFIIYNI